MDWTGGLQGVTSGREWLWQQDECDWRCDVSRGECMSDAVSEEKKEEDENEEEVKGRAVRRRRRRKRG